MGEASDGVSQDQDWLQGALTRLPRWMAVAGAAGVTITGIYGGWQAAVSFGLGAIASYANYRLIERGVAHMERLATAGRPTPGAAGLTARVLLRFLLIGGGVCVMLFVSGLSLMAAFLGLFVAPAAVALEILFELTLYARTYGRRT